MIKWIKRLFRLALLLVIVALIFNFHYKGKSAREYAREYGTKAFQYVYGRAKALMGKDLEELTPKSLSDIPGKLKEIAGPGEKSAEGSKTTEDTKLSKTAETGPSEKSDSLTQEDRDALKKLLEQKSQKRK